MFLHSLVPSLAAEFQINPQYWGTSKPHSAQGFFMTPSFSSFSQQWRSSKKISCKHTKVQTLFQQKTSLFCCEYTSDTICLVPAFGTNFKIHMSFFLEIHQSEKNSSTKSSRVWRLRHDLFLNFVELFLTVFKSTNLWICLNPQPKH